MVRLIFMLVAGALYAGLVWMTYVTYGPGFQLRFNPETPVASLERLALWLGVRAISVTLSFCRALWDLLSEASAEVGEWFIAKRSEEVQSTYRSRFL
jgi:hypothetical protein